MSDIEKMTAVEITSPGRAEVLAPREVARPYAQAGEIVIRTRAAGVNRPDVLQRLGVYSPPPDASPLPGLEVAGEVSQVGAGVTNWREGDAVVALTNGGGYAEYAAVPAGQALPLPAGWSMNEGAALPETLFTVQHTLIGRAGLGMGQTALIHGGASGIGATAIQLARFAGAVPYCTVSNAEKAAYATSMGAEAVINYVEEDFVSRIEALTDGRGVDVILDIVGGDYADRHLDCIAQGGTLIQLAVLGGTKAEINTGKLLRKHVTWFGSTLRPQAPEVKARIAEALHREVWPHLEDGSFLKPRIRTFPLVEAADAHRAMESPDHYGKLVLTI